MRGWVALMLLVASGAQADARYWTRLLAPDVARAERLVRDGRAQLSPALALAVLPLNEPGARSLEPVRARFALAKELDPASREARRWLAKVMQLSARTRDERQAAIAELTALRVLDPLYEAEDVALELGILHARDGALDDARAEYERSLAMHSDDAAQPTQLLDLAEVWMLQGELARALALYERVTREGEPGARVLALWGGAVVLDRMGDERAALAMARRALQEDRAPFAALHRAGVFFVPAHEAHYYEALGELASVHQADARSKEAREHLKRALDGFTRFYEADREGPFSDVAAEHIAALTRALAR